MRTLTLALLVTFLWNCRAHAEDLQDMMVRSQYMNQTNAINFAGKQDQCFVVPIRDISGNVIRYETVCK